MESPFHRLFKKHLDYSILKVFGCRCFPYLRDRASSKFEPKSYPCVFIGYSTIHKGFRCYHPPSRKVFLSRHVVFDEHVFPYADPRSLFSTSQGNNAVTTYEEFDRWQNPEKNDSPSIQGEQTNTMDKFNALSKSQHGTCPCLVDPPLSSVSDVVQDAHASCQQSISPTCTTLPSDHPLHNGDTLLQGVSR